MPEPRSAHRSARWRSSLGWPAAVAIALLHAALAISSARLESSTFDEGLHLAAGYSNWLGGDQRLHSGNGLLPQMWFALPLVLDRERFSFPDPDRVIATQAVDDFHLLTHFLAHVFFYEVGNDPAEILARARPMAALLGAALCLGVYAWARRLWGAGPGLLACGLCALSPNVLAHARLATSDLMFTTALFGALALVWHSFWRPSLASGLAAGAALAASALTKVSAVGAIPMVALLLGLRALWPAPLVWRGRLRTLPPLDTTAHRAAGLIALASLQALAAATIIWAAYGFRYDVVPEDAPGRAGMAAQWAWVHEREGIGLSAIDGLRELRALPEGFLYGAAFVLRHSEERNHFFRGSTGRGGDWRFFPYAIGVKTPLALFALLAVAGVAWLRAPPDARGPIGLGAAPLLALISVHGLLAMTSEINLGLRHVLPLYPALFTLAGGAAAAFAGRALRSAAIGLAAAFALASASIWPHYLAYFNALVGPSNGYRVLVDSSLDWGQDLDNLRRHLKDPGQLPDQPIYLSYFGSADPMFHDFGELDLRLLPGFFDWATIQHREARADLDWTLEPGWYAISASMLQQAWTGVAREWTAAEERDFARLATRFRSLEQQSDPAAAVRAAIAEPETRNAWLRYRALRLSRLCQVLRTREPDQQVGHSILLYRVGAVELARVTPP